MKASSGVTESPFTLLPAQKWEEAAHLVLLTRREASPGCALPGSCTCLCTLWHPQPAKAHTTAFRLQTHGCSIEVILTDPLQDCCVVVLNCPCSPLDGPFVIGNLARRVNIFSLHMDFAGMQMHPFGHCFSTHLIRILSALLPSRLDSLKAAVNSFTLRVSWHVPCLQGYDWE